MQTNQTARALAEVPLFSELAPAVLEALAGRARRRRYGADETIFHEGDPGQSLYIIESGRVKIVSVSEQGQEAMLAVMGPGEYFGELALFDDKPRSADVVAIESAQMLTLAREDLFAIVDRYPATARHIMSVLSDQIRRLTEGLSDIVFLNLDARVAKKLLELSQAHGVDVPEGRRIEINLNQAEIGALVGATRESVNQCLRRFQDAKLVGVTRQRITILKPDGLRRRITY